MTYMQKAADMPLNRITLARTLESLDTERTRADKAEQRERELRGGLEKFCKAYRVCGGPGALHDAYLEAEQILSRALIQPEPDPLVEAVKDCGYATLDCIEPEFAADLRAALAKHGLSIVKGESL